MTSARVSTRGDGAAAPAAGAVARPAPVNLPATATAADVYDVYQAAWEAGCKGITVYRDGSRAGQPKAL